MDARLFFRLAAPCVAISLLFLGMAVVAALYVLGLQQNLSNILAEDVASVRAAEELEIGLREVQAELHQYLLTGDRKHLEAVGPLRAETDHWLEVAERLALTPPEQELIGHVKQGYQHFFDELPQLHPQSDDPEVPRRLRLLLTEVLPRDILRPAHEFLDINEVAVTQSSEHNQRLANGIALGLLLLGLFGAGAGVLTGSGIARVVNRSLVQLSVPVRDAAGRLADVVGPVTLQPGWRFRDLEAVLRTIAEQVGVVIDRLQQSQRDALRAEQLAAAGQLAAGLAHELRNPLMAMKLLVQAAAAGEDGQLTGRDLAVIEEEITRLEQLVQTFLDFARPPQPRLRRFEVRGVLQETIGLMAGRADGQGARIDCDVGAGLQLEADVGQFRQVLLNLLLNALDSVGAGGTVRVEVGAEREPLGLIVRVRDSGPGLPAGLGAQIFEPFVSTKETGMGLGLSICKRIVDAHAGSITAENERGAGAVFTVRWPLTPCGGNSYANAVGGR
jgi:signal transduction histidine kinase